MKKFTVYYKDHIGRKNQADSYGADADEARRKFQILYPDCRVVDVV
jgi:hypothetical protein